VPQWHPWCRVGTAPSRTALGFDLREAKAPVFLWQGERDGNVSSAGARYLANTIPGCVATFYPNDAHISVVLNHRREILVELTRGLQ
jgi:hypothetical protein